MTIDGVSRVSSVVMAEHHLDRDDLVEMRENGERHTSTFACATLWSEIIEPVIRDFCDNTMRRPDCTVNGVGVFTEGGPFADAGEVGRKIVVDAYGPRIPVGGGAYSGKDATKVDRSAAYMACYIAKTAVTHEFGKECLVRIAYAIGKQQPEMVTAINERGEDLSSWVRYHFDLAPWSIIAQLNLWTPKGWRYQDAAAHGHYGNRAFPWEQPDPTA